MKKPGRATDPAFPSGASWAGAYGLTIREEFASRMLAAVIAGPESRDDTPPHQMVDIAVNWADALIERLSKP